MSLGNRSKALILALLALLLIFSLTACGTTENAQDVGPKQNEVQQETNEEPIKQSEPDTGYFPISVTDGAGRSVTIEQEPMRIISLIPSNTEIAYALGLGDRVVAVTDNDNYPEDVLTKDKVGGFELNLEMIIALEPDLVLANIYQKYGAVDVISKLEEANITVIVIDDAHTFEATYDTFRLIGEATGKSLEAEELISKTQVRYNKVAEQANSIPDEDKLRVWVEFSGPPEVFTAGNGTIINEMLNTLGAVNVVGEHDGWLMLTEEEIVSLHPDVILINYSYIDNAVEQLKARSGWSSVPAVMNNQVFLTDEDLLSRPGPRLIDGLEMLAQIIYPHIFK